MQVCGDQYTAARVLPLTPNVTVTVLRMKALRLSSFTFTQMLSCAPLLGHVEVQIVFCNMDASVAPQTLQALSSLPQSITWRPLELWLEKPQALSTVHEVCAALAGTPLAQAVSKLILSDWQVEPSIAVLRATFPNVLHFELWGCPPSMASSLSEAIAAWPMLRSISLTDNAHTVLAAQQHFVEAAAHTAAELKAGQPFEIVLYVESVGKGVAEEMDMLVAATTMLVGARFMRAGSRGSEAWSHFVWCISLIARLAGPSMIRA